jgi:hypothetical protein
MACSTNENKEFVESSEKKETEGKMKIFPAEEKLTVSAPRGKPQAVSSTDNKKEEKAF